MQEAATGNRVKALIHFVLAMLLLATGTCLAESDQDLTNKALFDFVAERSREFGSVFSGGLKAVNRHVQAAIYESRAGNRRTLEAICAAVVNEVIDDASRNELQLACEKRFLHMIAVMSQTDRMSPYRVAGGNELEWRSHYASIASGDLAFVLEGHYRFPAGHYSCRSTNNCCDMDGALYLNSCRTPTADEQKAIDICAAECSCYRSEEYMNCLRDQGVTVGCEDQDDGSRLCY